MTIRQTPVCPGCGDVLNPQAATTRDAVVVCQPCSRAPDVLWHGVLEAMRASLLAPHRTHASGLTFYTPRTIRPIGAYQHALQLDGLTQPGLPGIDDSHESATQREVDPLRA